MEGVIMKNKIAKIFLGIGVGLLAAGLHVMLMKFYDDLRSEMTAKDVLAILLIGGSIGALTIGLLLFER